MKKLLLGLLFIALSTAAFAEELGPSTYAASAIQGEIQRIYVLKETNYVVQFKVGAEVIIKSGESGYPLTDRAKNSREFMIVGTSEQKKEMLALLLAGQLQGKEVLVRLDGTVLGTYDVIAFVCLND